MMPIISTRLWRSLSDTPRSCVRWHKTRAPKPRLKMFADCSASPSSSLSTIFPTGQIVFLSNSSYVLFCEGDYDENRPMTIVKLHEDDCVSNYYIYPRLDLEWSAEDKMLVNTFVSVMYIIHDRLRIASVAERYSVMDNKLELYKLRYFMKKSGELFARGEIREH